MTKATAKSGIFRSPPIDQAEDDKLHDLYWSRAKLKQDLAEKAKENRQLRNIIRKQQSSTARAEQELANLENLLVDPQWIHNLVVFYRFRGLNARCCAELRKFADRLKLQREQRRRKSLLANWKARRNAKIAKVEQALARQRQVVRDIEHKVTAERTNMESMNPLSKLLKGRQSNGAVDELEEQLALARVNAAKLASEREKVKALKPPSVPVMDTGTKRSVNLMMLAFAQGLLLRFSDRNMASMVREASNASPGGINYGSPADCAKLLQQLDDEHRRLETLSDSPQVLKARAVRIAEHADFSSPDDAIPVAGTVAAVFAFDSGGNVETTDTNILGQDYWELSSVVLR